MWTAPSGLYAARGQRRRHVQAGPSDVHRDRSAAATCEYSLGFEITEKHFDAIKLVLKTV